MRGVGAAVLLVASAGAQAPELARPYAFAARAPQTQLERAIDAAMASVVKVHGASGLATIEAYASGVVVNDQGYVLTLDLVMLQPGQTRVVLGDGSVHPAELLPAEARLGVRMLKIDPAGSHLVPVTPSPRRDWPVGTLVVSIGNAFRLAEFSEPMSATFGVLAGRVRTGLRYRLADVADQGELLLTDAANNPGQYGGGLFALGGEWLGLNTRLVASTETNTQLSAAIPACDLLDYIERSVRGQPAPRADAPAPARLRHGVVLFDEGLRRSPPAYVERVERDSPAQRAGLRPDDLIVRVDDQPVRTCAEFRAVLARSTPGQVLVVTVKRGGQVLRIELVPEEDKS